MGAGSLVNHVCTNGFCAQAVCPIIMVIIPMNAMIIRSLFNTIIIYL